MSIDVPGPVAFAIIIITLVFLWHVYKRKVQKINEMRDIPETIPPTGFEIPLLAAFTGIKGMPRKTHHAHNNINPSLTLFEDRIECRVVFKKSIRLSEIERVDIWDTVTTRNLQVHVRGQEEVFTANLLNRENLAQVLGYLRDRDVPLNKRSTDFLAANPVG